MDEKVLVVEDEQQTLSLIVSKLLDAGYNVHGTTRGDKAIQIAIREKPDVDHC